MMYPPQITYNTINPKGFFSVFKQWSIQPVASGGVFWPGQNVKILIQSIVGGVMDPYRSHLQIQVQSDIDSLPVGQLQVDSSAQSFIEQLVITSKNRQIQRIPQYGVLAAWLTDIGLSQLYAQGRQTQGLGYTNIDSMNPYSYQTSPNTSVFSQNDTGKTSPMFMEAQVHSNGTINPTFPSAFPSYSGYTGGTLTTKKTDGSDETSSTFPPISQVNLLTQSHTSSINTAWIPDRRQTSLTRLQLGKFSDDPNFFTVGQCSLQRFGIYSNMRAQYISSIKSKAYPDSTTSLPTNQIHLDRGVLGKSYPSLYATGIKYTTNIPQTRTYVTSYSRTWAQLEKIPNVTSLNGFSTLYSPNFCKGVNQPFISPTVPQCQMINGLLLKQKIAVSKRTFKIPIISAVLGLLIPEDQFVLIPIKGLNQILIQLLIDKYAMFTSGYNDIAQFDSNGMGLQQNRAFVIKKCTYNMHTYQFFQPQIDDYLNKSLLNRIMLNVNMWTLGNQYTIAKGQNVNNSWPVGCTSQALNQVVALFVPLDYQRYSFCRKHFRISNNLTKFQLRINMDYYPSQPIRGNGGNPCTFEGLDNSAYIQNIFWSNNFMFNTVNPFPRINAYNFAINDRCYDIHNTNTFYQKTMINNQSYNWHLKSINADTALGMSSIHQNRYVGKAGYTYSFEPYAHSAYFLTGMDCRQVRQFDLILGTNSVDNFPRQQTLFIFTRSSVILEFTQNGVNIYGR